MSSGIGLSALLSMLILLTLVGATASAVADEIELDRHVAVSEDSDGFHAVSDSQGFNVNDRFDLIFSEGSLSLWYTEDTSAASPPAWELEVSFERLTSFVDNGNGRFDSGDTVVSTHDISESAYSLTYSTAPLPDGGNKTTVTAVSESGVLTLGFVITSSPALAGQVPISPSDVKLDIRISGLDLGGEADRIGLVMSIDVDMQSTIDLEDFDGSEQLNLTQSSLGGFLRWADNATVDGVQRPVGATWVDGTLTLSYQAGQVIVHDPIIGIRSVAPLSGQFVAVKPLGDPLLYGVGLALAAAAILGAVAIRGKRSH